MAARVGPQSRYLALGHCSSGAGCEQLKGHVSSPSQRRAGLHVQSLVCVGSEAQGWGHTQCARVPSTAPLPFTEQTGCWY